MFGNTDALHLYKVAICIRNTSKYLLAVTVVSAEEKKPYKFNFEIALKTFTYVTFMLPLILSFWIKLTSRNNDLWVTKMCIENSQGCFILHLFPVKILQVSRIIYKLTFLFVSFNVHFLLNFCKMKSLNCFIDLLIIYNLWCFSECNKVEKTHF